MRSQPGRAYLIVGSIAFAGGCLWVGLDSAAWYYGQQYFAVFAQQTILSLVLNYYLIEGLTIGVAVAGAYLIYRGLRNGAAAEPDSVRSIIAGAVGSRRDLRIGVLAAVIYAAVYMLVSSIVVFQPGVNFLTYYGVSSPGWNAAACCGSPGTVPVLIVYLSPQAHLALQILPLDALFVIVVPLLVGFNVTVAAYSMRNKVLRGNAGWLGSVGVLTGLFTGCPTCAGLFLAGAVGGIGATGLAVALAPYQMLFILLSIPLLVASPVLVALNAKRAIRAACLLPTSRPGA
jgi:hypothetical protein